MYRRLTIREEDKSDIQSCNVTVNKHTFDMRQRNKDKGKWTETKRRERNGDPARDMQMRRGAYSLV